MNDIEEISPLRGFIRNCGEFFSTKIRQLRCRSVHARNISASEFQSIMKTPRLFEYNMRTNFYIRNYNTLSIKLIKGAETQR